ncbi:hypothetical protein GHV40_10555 [Devosia sp. D6-9]|nr:hypothetical protein GHV40_10555 [Devosia sp. D6-9]
MNITLGLREIPNYIEGTACVPTAIAAITGLTPQQIAQAIADAAPGSSKPAIVTADPTKPFDINHWVAAIDLLGLKWHEGVGWHSILEDQRAPIRYFLQNHVAADDDRRILLMFAERRVAGKDPMTHVFAIQGNEIVDTSTFGRKLALKDAAITDDFNEFRMKRIFEITQ